MLWPKNKKPENFNSFMETAEWVVMFAADL